MLLPLNGQNRRILHVRKKSVSPFHLRKAHRAGLDSGKKRHIHQKMKVFDILKKFFPEEQALPLSKLEFRYEDIQASRGSLHQSPAEFDRQYAEIMDAIPKSKDAPDTWVNAFVQTGIKHNDPLLIKTLYDTYGSRSPHCFSLDRSMLGLQAVAANAPNTLEWILGNIPGWTTPEALGASLRAAGKSAPGTYAPIMKLIERNQSDPVFMKSLFSTVDTSVADIISRHLSSPIGAAPSQPMTAAETALTEELLYLPEEIPGMPATSRVL